MAVRKNTLAYMFITVTERMILHMASPNGQLKSSTVSTAQKGRVSTNWRSVTAKLSTKKFTVDLFRFGLTLMKKRTSRLPISPAAHTTEYTKQMRNLRIRLPSADTSMSSRLLKQSTQTTATAASALLRLATAPGCVCEECEECDEECVELPDDTRLLLLPELLAPLAGALSEAAEGAPDWSRNSWEEAEVP
ncbi:hypothetical protein EYF80_020845 [Liparis tanakae]|uniref:Uncharacterized protein n=1 Tax=Liparis tanakae TaxID=230148 RepID=A0A4Z2HVE8_9TELE|nr:hypothetical protein EYF80_020845 [Liparis tanakae]